MQSAWTKVDETFLEFEAGNPMLTDGASDIFADGTDFDSKAIRIDFRLPGPLNDPETGVAVNSSTNPGTNWGVITGGTALDGSPLSGVSLVENYKSYIGTPTVDGNLLKFSHRLGSPSSNATHTNGIVLMRVRFKSNATGSEHVIKSLTITEG